MANPRPGQKGYSGPVGEGWGRPIQNIIKAADKSARDTQRSVQQHMSNAAGLGDDVLTNLFGGGTTARNNARRLESRVNDPKFNSRVTGGKPKDPRNEKRSAGKKRPVTRSGRPITSSMASRSPKDPRNEKRSLANATSAARRAAPKKSKSDLAKVGAKIRKRNPGLSTAEVRARGRAMLNKRGTGRGDS